MTAQGPDSPDGAGRDRREAQDAAREAARTAGLLARQLGRLAGSAGRSLWRQSRDAARRTASAAGPALRRERGPVSGPTSAPIPAAAPEPAPARPGLLARLRRRPALAVAILALLVPIAVLAAYVLAAFATLPPLGGVLLRKEAG